MVYSEALDGPDGNAGFSAVPLWIAVSGVSLT